jgi:hypothetical protein
MDSVQTWITTFIAVGGLLGTLVTAVATLFLWRVTKLLAVETKRMAEASAQPHVVATLDPNRWSMRHFDLKVDNTGNATAYDIKVDFTPPLINGEGRAGAMAVPFENISLLKPGQGMGSYLAEYSIVSKRVYSVRVSWRRSPADSQREENAYTINMADRQGVSDLGGDPMVNIANDLAKIREDLRSLAQGSKRLKIDAYTAGDRLHERRVAARQRRRWASGRHTENQQENSQE